jgi:replicative DNA helicase Mcm
LQIDTQFKEPTRCSCGRRGKFRLLNKDLVDAQRLIIEEAPESLVGGEQPKRLSVFLKEDLVEPIMEKKTTPGSKIKISGILKEIPILLKTGVQSIRYDLIAEANYIDPLEQTFEDIEINKEDEQEIINLSKDPQIYEKLIKSMAPSIYGHEKIKEAVVLQSMGGVRKLKEDGTIIRGDIHILLVGDPGASKSTLLTFISKAAPKARYVAGRSTTGAGITASVVKDEFLRGWALEAGAIVLANKGILLLDELDKMTQEDTSALHEAMEQQQVSISKANIQATLKAETTVLAAANPKLGRFDPYQPIATQIDLPSTLINRFDLIFPVRDIPDKKLDEKIAKHILEIQKKTDIVKPPISTTTLKKYIAYVKQKIFPKLTQEAIEEIKSFYVNLRSSGQTGDEVLKPIPISARQLEALVRLAEGSARVRLADEVKREDAKKAIELLKYCLMMVGFDHETGQIDIDRITTGITSSQRSKLIIVKEIISDLGNKYNDSIPVNEIIAEAVSKGLKEDQAEEAIEKLKREGEIIEPNRGKISKV